MRRLFCATLMATIGALVCTGCVNYNWEDNIERAEQRAKVEKKYLFVFYKWWFLPESNRMENDVLQQPDVAKVFQDTVNCLIVYDWPPNRAYMAKHGVGQAPGFLIMAPEGSYQQRTGYVPKEAFIRWAEAAMPKGPEHNQERPTKPPPVTPQRAP